MHLGYDRTYNILATDKSPNKPKIQKDSITNENILPNFSDYIMIHPEERIKYQK